MAPSAAYGLTKVAREQGECAAQTALRIFAGSRPADILLPTAKPHTISALSSAGLSVTVRIIGG
jgi:hypothetical protein